MTIHEPITLVAGADDRYAMPMAAMLASAVDHLPGRSRARLLLLDGGISPRSKSRLLDVVKRVARAKVETQFVSVDLGKIKRLREVHWFTQAMYLRILIPELVPEGCKKALYLDSDVIVADDLGKIWSLEMGDHPLFAVQDPGIPFVSSTWGIDSYRKLGLPGKTPYFNSGVLLINIDRYRDLDIQGKALWYLRRFRDSLRFPDQEALNVAAMGTCGRLDCRWNVNFERLRELERWPESRVKEESRKHFSELLRNPGVVHFYGSNKPWLPDRWVEGQERFFEYLERSAWFSPAEWKRWRLSLLRGKALAYDRQEAA